MFDSRLNTYHLDAAERELYHMFGKLQLPRHTSYPAVPFWTVQPDASAYMRILSKMAQNSTPVSWYVHVPFCERLCHYCGCNKLIIRRDTPDSSDFADRYIAGITKELTHLPQGQRWNVHQLHFGGGTPTWLKPEEFSRLWKQLMGRIDLAPEAEVSIELDPRVTTDEHLQLLRDLGFNRVSLGVQDFAGEVQQAIQRIQPFEMVAEFTPKCRAFGFKSVNYDLIYGLPMQTRDSMQQTIERVSALKPDRIAFYRLALMPEIFKWQRTFRPSDIPDDESTLDFMLAALQGFSESGYQFLGLDHFALNSEELSKAFMAGKMRRTFQGMTTGHDLPIIGIGPSAISCLDEVYSQNEPQFPRWAKRVNESLAVVKGHALTQNDHIARWTINQLYCNRRIDKGEFGEKFEIGFDEFYVSKMSDFSALVKAGLIENTQDQFLVKPLLGWLLLRVVAAALDQYLPPGTWREGLENGGSRVG